MNMREAGQQVLKHCRERGWATLETGISRPVPQVEAGGIQIWYLLYRSQVRIPHQILYPPFAHVGADYPSGRVIGFKPLSGVDLSQSLGRYPHRAVQAIPSDRWEATWNELFGLYPAVIAAFTGGMASDRQKRTVARFAQLFYLTTPPFMLEHYRALNPAFFEWLGQVPQEQAEF